MSTLEETVEFATNSQPRCACVLILDTSSSMQGPPIDGLNAGLVTLQNALLHDEIAKKRVEIAVVEFNSNIRVVQDFVTAEQFQPPTLTATGLTELAGGVNQGLDLLQRRKRQYANNGVPFYRPWAFLITDGQVKDYQQVATRIREEESQKRVAFFAIGVDGADEESLRNISVRPHKMLAKLKFNDLFLWLSRSLGAIARTPPGHMDAVDDGTGAWSVM